MTSRHIKARAQMTEKVKCTGKKECERTWRGCRQILNSPVPTVIASALNFHDLSIQIQIVSLSSRNKK
jgi:hypothetical protein